MYVAANNRSSTVDNLLHSTVSLYKDKYSKTLIYRYTTKLKNQYIGGEVLSQKYMFRSMQSPLKAVM